MSDTNKTLIESLEKAIKEAYSAKNFEAAKAKIQEIAQVDPDNRLAQKILQKIEKDSQPKAPSFWSKLFAKKEVPQAPAPEKAAAAPDSNAFTQLFVKEPQSEERIIDTIVAKAGETKEVKKAPQAPKELGTGEGFAKFANVFFQFSVLFIVITAGFFYVQNLDYENRFMGLVTGQENVASRLHSAAEERDALKQKEIDLVRQSSKLKKGNESQIEATLKEIVDQRLDWSDITAKIDEVTSAVYEKNDLAQYIRYDSYTLDSATKKVTVTGTLSDPLGKNLTKLVELEQAFQNYPRNPEALNDKTEPYFKEVSKLSSVSKNLDNRSGKYLSTFQISFSL
jgi:hypothetical protein